MKPFVRTVLGDIAPEDLGVCDAHEHLIRSGGKEIDLDSGFLMDDTQAAGEELSSWLEAGGRSMVCMDPIGCGRNVPKMLEVAESFRGRAHLLMCTGFHKGALYDTRCHWLATLQDMEQIVELLALEITQGMDRHSYNGPVVERTGAKAGLIKAGTGLGAISDFEHKALAAAALTQQKTGAPISIHTQAGTMGREVAAFLQEKGARMDHVILCHVQKTADRYYHRQLLETGAYLCYDVPDREFFVPDSFHIENMLWLMEQGYQQKLLLSMDAGYAGMQAGYSRRLGRHTPGIAYLLQSFVPQLRQMGATEEAVADLLVHNPARALSFFA